MQASKGINFSGTFSILAMSPDFKLMGIAVASGSTYVGDRVPHAKPGIGAVVTQAYTNVLYGIKGLELLRKGLTPQETLSTLLREDPESEMRQVAVMDFKRRKAVFTGARVPLYSGEIVGDNYVVVGNMLSAENVVSDMAKEFENSLGNFALRMVKVLKTGSESGGDIRGEKSAALIIISAEKIELNIKVNVNKNPVDELYLKLEL